MGASREVLLFYTANRSTDHFRLRKGLSIHGFLRLGVPPPGCAPGFVPNPGHPALIPDASAALPLRAPLAWTVVVSGGRSCCALSTYHAVLAVKGCACLARWRPGGRLWLRLRPL